MLHSFFVNYLPEIYFVYGLSFFIMGIAIAFQHRRGSSFTMAGSLWLLALFGFLHGLSEWMFFYIPYKAPTISSEWVFVLNVVEVNLIGGSFVLLLFFGIRLLGDVIDRNFFKYIFYAAVVLALFWVFYFIFYRLILVGDNTGYWLSYADIFSRYFFGLPGGLLAAYAIYRQKDQVKLFGGTAILLSLKILAVSFLGYALFAGLIVPYAPFFPASFINTQNVFQWTQVPTALFRTFFSLCITFSMLKVLNLFQIENAAFVSKMVEENAVLMERERIKRDLHDGIIQSLYALGLQLKNGEYLLEEQKISEAREKVADSIENVDHIIRDLRFYIQDLKRAELAGLSLNQLLSNLVNLSERFGIRVTVDNRVRSSVKLAAETKMHLYHILQELVTNVIKHADADCINIKLSSRAGNIVVEVEDDGLGFNSESLRKKQETKEKLGLLNIRERIKSMHGYFDINSETGKGTRTAFEIPVEAENS